jgi:hypothetical protein
MKVTQVELEFGNEHQICWLPSEHNWKAGMYVSLKNNPRIWYVRKVFSSQEHYEINRKWNVGGL